MTGILYFSSTGNSLWLAQQVQAKFGGKIIYLPRYHGDGHEFAQIILVTPIYSFGMPTFVYDLLPRLHKTTPLIVIQNYGGMVGGADRLLYDYARQNGLNIKAVYLVKMPENFTLYFTVPQFYLRLALKKAQGRIDKILAQVARGEYRIPRPGRTKAATYQKNKANWHLIGQRFHCNSNCTHCGKCVAICPAGNITMQGGQIVFGDRCVACLGCYHRCPQKAITYQNKKKKFRYVNPNIDPENIGKDL